MYAKSRVLVSVGSCFFSYPPPKTKDGPKYRQPKNPDQIQSSGSLNLLGQRPIEKKRNKIDGFYCTIKSYSANNKKKRQGGGGELGGYRSNRNSLPFTHTKKKKEAKQEARRWGKHEQSPVRLAIGMEFCFSFYTRYVLHHPSTYYFMPSTLYENNNHSTFPSHEV